MEENMFSQLQNATPGMVAATLAALSPNEQLLIREAIDLLEPKSEKMMDGLTYHVTMVDGSDFEMTLDREATLQDACSAIAAEKHVRASQVKVLLLGQSQPLKNWDVRFCEVTEGCTELLAILSSTLDFGMPSGPLAPFCARCSLEHYAVSTYLSNSMTDRLSLETCDGQEIFLPSSSAELSGVIFAEGSPLSGKVLMRFLVHQRKWAMGFGIATAPIHLDKDPEFSEHFFGFYHGGRSENVCMKAKRIFRGRHDRNLWGSGSRLAILFDFDEHSMQCFNGLEPVGPKSLDLPQPAVFWPVVSLCKAGDHVSLSVSYA